MITEPQVSAQPAHLRGLTAALFSSEGFDDAGLRFRHKQRVYPSAPALDRQPTQLALVFEGSDLFSGHGLNSVAQCGRVSDMSHPHDGPMDGAEATMSARGGIAPRRKPTRKNAARRAKTTEDATMFLARVKIGCEPEVSQVRGSYRIRAWTFCSYGRGACAYGRSKQQAIVLARQALARMLMGKIYRLRSE
jgi:hypothetical protein